MKVSIITAFYHGQQYMEGYINCMEKNMQALDEADEIEVVLVNDSPEDRLEVGDGGAHYITVITNEKNSGIHQSRVNGLKAATGDYIMFLDQDDLLADDAIAKFLARIRDLKSDGSRVDVIVANALLEQSDGRELTLYRTDYHKKCVGDFETYLTVGTQIISPGQCLVRKGIIPFFWMEHILKNNGSDDFFLWILLLAEGVKFEYLDEILYRHVYTAKNLSADTTVTDDSNYEFIDYLADFPNMEQEDIFKLHSMIAYKAQFRGSKAAGKAAASLANLGIFAKNVVYKKKTDTRLGFNR